MISDRCARIAAMGLMLLGSAAMLLGCATGNQHAQPATGIIPISEPALDRFIVFFEFDSFSISADGQAVIQELLKELPYRSRDVEISVDGYTDRSGPEAYNAALALRRAEAVSAFLVARGVKPAAIVRVEGWGEREQAVATADGVREPLNRRVIIHLVE